MIQMHGWDIQLGDHDYNTVPGLTELVKTLDGLYAIEDARKKANDRKETLVSFILLGRWVVDSWGNFMSINLTPLPPISAPVISARELERMFNLCLSWGGSEVVTLPPRGSKCVECGCGFTLENVHLNHMERVPATKETVPNEHGFRMDSYRPYHTSCWRFRQLCKSLQHFEKIFKDAGFDEVVLTQTPNQYDQKSLVREPWFYVDTVLGKFLIGLRRHVIHIDWEAIGHDMSGLFEDVQQTKGPHHIHAYGADQASEFLRRIRDALGARARAATSVDDGVKKVP